MVGVTARGSLVLLSSATGAPIRALVRGGVIGDEISVSADGQTIYFSRRHGCVDDVESVALSGGKPTLITTGSLPAISPDGSTLAFARQPTLTRHCMAGSGDASAQYALVTRTLSTGVERVYPVLPAGAFATMTPNYEPVGLTAPVRLLNQLSAMRYHRSDAHAVAWRAAGLTAPEMVAIQAAGGARRCR